MVCFEMGLKGSEFNMLVNISIFLIAITLLIIAIAVSKALIKTSAVITTLGKTVSTVESELDSLMTEFEKTLVEVNETATDVEHKLASTNGLFMAIQDIGVTTSMISGEFESRTQQFADEKSLPGVKPFIHAIQIGEFTLGLFRTWKKGKGLSK